MVRFRSFGSLRRTNLGGLATRPQVSNLPHSVVGQVRMGNQKYSFKANCRLRGVLIWLPEPVSTPKV
jgi:hypothetical protein